jgi:magnesium chelatase accessory protein
MAKPLDWERDGLDWPHREASRFIQAGGLRWHVQQMGAGPVMLLLHGTGSSAHSWRSLMPLLARRFEVVAMDLPGHAFTQSPPAAGSSLPGMAALLRALIARMGLEVNVVVGHSAGAAIAARLSLDGAVAPDAIVAINGAMLPLGGIAGVVFPPVARLMASTPVAAQLFARRRWDRPAVERLVSGTGSMLDDQGLSLYARLMSDPKHAAAALAMMARWDLQPLARDLARLRTPLAAIVGVDDKAVPPRDAERVARAIPAATPRSIDRVAAAGHLVHEEQPAKVARLMTTALAR